MKLAMLSTTVAIAALSIATPVQAENPAHVKQLLATGECPSCDLSGANLSGAHLIGADL